MDKKRWRPSLTEYRALQRQLEEQMNGTSVVVRECHEWREKYRELYKQALLFQKQIKELKETSVAAGVYYDLKSHDEDVYKQSKDNFKKAEKLAMENSVLEKSNNLLGEEIERLRKQAKDASIDYNRARKEVLWYRSRGFFDRLFNKKYKEEEDV